MCADMSTKILSKPLDIGAPDLIRGVPFSHSGTLYVQVKRLLGKKKWQSRYVVISQGCLYVYEDKNAKHTENTYIIKQFESLKEFDADSDESFCFCIKFEIPTKKPLIFASDTKDNRMKWMNELDKAIQTVQQFSADSGFGSGGSFSSRDNGYASGSTFSPRDSKLPGEMQDEADVKGYEEISDWYMTPAVPRPVQESLETLKSLSNSSSMLSIRSAESSLQSERRTMHTHDGVILARDSADRLQRTDQDSVYVNTGLSTGSDCRASSSPFMSGQCLENESLYMNTDGPRGFDRNQQTLSNGLPFSRDLASFTSTSMSYLSISGQMESVDEESDSTSCDSDTLPKTVYESPEEDLHNIYANAQLFETSDYYCDSIKTGKSKMRAKPNGTFLVCPGETTKLNLCVKTPNGDISFRIHEQDGKMSLFKDFSKESYVFPSLDTLLRYYHIYELPSKNFKVKLERGCNIKT